MTKARTKEATGVGDLLKQFGDGHRQCYKGTPYLAAFDRDSRILRDMLEVYSLEFMRELIHCFWMAKKRSRADEDYYIGRAKPNVPGFRGALPNLISEFEFDTPPDERGAVGPAQGELPDTSGNVGEFDKIADDLKGFGERKRCCRCNMRVPDDATKCHNCKRELPNNARIRTERICNDCAGPDALCLVHQS